MTSDPVKQAWQASVEIAGAPPLDEVRKGADKFYRYVKWRNLVEYAACVVVVVGFGTYVFTLPHPLQRVGSALVVLATVYVAWQLHRRASAEAPDKAGTMPIYTFIRAQLVRQRDALAGIFWWYILPFLPGLLLMSIGNAQDPEFFAASLLPPWARWVVFGSMAAVMVGIWWMNQLVARKLQRHIDEIDALMGKNE